MLSIVIPAYNEEGNILNTCKVISDIMKEAEIDFDFVFVNDGSKDTTWEKLVEASKIYPNVNAINFSRNFGKESAVFAGLKHAKGDAVVVMDCDLQHPPETVVKMYKIWKNNDVDIVEGVKADRGKESAVYKIFASMFYSIIMKTSKLDMKSSSDFKLMDKKVVNSINEMPERLTFFRAMSSWVGYKKEKVEFVVAKREIGETKWSFTGLFKYAINSITSFTSSPMQIVTFFGFLLLIISVVLGGFTFVNWILGNSLEGFTTVIILQLLTSSIIMFSLGVIGFYLSKIYEEIKNRPRYIVSDLIKTERTKKTDEI